MGGLTAAIVGIALLIGGIFYVNASQINRRSEELQLYLKAVRDWNEVHSRDFDDLRVRLLDTNVSSNRTIELDMEKKEVETESNIRLALGLAYQYNGKIINKPLTGEHAKQHIYQNMSYVAEFRQSNDSLSFLPAFKGIEDKDVYSAPFRFEVAMRGKPGHQVIAVNEDKKSAALIPLLKKNYVHEKNAEACKRHNGYHEQSHCVHTSKVTALCIEIDKAER